MRLDARVSSPMKRRVVFRIQFWQTKHIDITSFSTERLLQAEAEADEREDCEQMSSINNRISSQIWRKVVKDTRVHRATMFTAHLHKQRSQVSLTQYLPTKMSKSKQQRICINKLKNFYFSKPFYPSLLRDELTPIASPPVCVNEINLTTLMKMWLSNCGWWASLQLLFLWHLLLGCVCV